MLLYGSALLLMVLGPTKLRETRIIFKSTVAIVYNRGFCRKIFFCGFYRDVPHSENRDKGNEKFL